MHRGCPRYECRSAALASHRKDFKNRANLLIEPKKNFVIAFQLFSLRQQEIGQTGVCRRPDKPDRDVELRRSRPLCVDLGGRKTRAHLLARPQLNSRCAIGDPAEAGATW